MVVEERNGLVEPETGAGEPLNAETPPEGLVHFITPAELRFVRNHFPMPHVGPQPALRPTIFSSRTLGGGTGIGKQKPTGFGRVSVRASRSTGSITGIRSGRSGSFGRAGGRSGG